MKSSTNHKPVTFVLCAAGKGERFIQEGLKRPKPLLNLNGSTMLERSLESLNMTSVDQLIIISQKDHKLKDFFSNIDAEWIEIQTQTKGQLDTFLFAKDHIRHENIVIYNCDTYFEAKNLRQTIDSGIYDGIIPCSQEPGNAWSFCKVDKDNNVLQVTEKDRISEWASVGYYYFKGRELLLKEAMKEINETKVKENYVAPLYERYLKKSYRIKMEPTDLFLPFGTVEQVKDYWGVSIEELISQNQ